MRMVSRKAFDEEIWEYLIETSSPEESQVDSDVEVIDVVVPIAISAVAPSSKKR